MKIAKVKALYDLANCRPIWLLPQFPKMFEIFFEKRLKDFIHKHKLINKGQYGFRANKCTSLAIIEATEAIDYYRYVLTVKLFIFY